MPISDLARWHECQSIHHAAEQVKILKVTVVVGQAKLLHLPPGALGQVIKKILCSGIHVQSWQSRHSILKVSNYSLSTQVKVSNYSLSTQSQSQ